MQNCPALLSCLAVQGVLSSPGRLAGSILRKSYYKKVESGTQGASTIVIVGAYEKETKGTVVTTPVIF